LIECDNENKNEIIKDKKIEKKLQLVYKINTEKKEKNQRKREKYILRTNACYLSDEEIWDIYNTIRRIEDSFKTMKTDLHIRPIYHQTRENSIAHIFLTVIAYHIVNIVLYRLKDQWESIRWGTFVETMNSQTIWTIIQETIEGQQIKTRIIDNPTKKQKKYYDILWIKSKPVKCRLLTHL